MNTSAMLEGPPKFAYCVGSIVARRGVGWQDQTAREIPRLIKVAHTDQNGDQPNL